MLEVLSRGLSRAIYHLLFRHGSHHKEAIETDCDHRSSPSWSWFEGFATSFAELERCLRSKVASKITSLIFSFASADRSSSHFAVRVGEPFLTLFGHKIGFVV